MFTDNKKKRLKIPKRVIRSHNSRKDNQYQMIKDNFLQNITQKMKHWATRTP